MTGAGHANESFYNQYHSVLTTSAEIMSIIGSLILEYPENVFSNFNSISTNTYKRLIIPVRDSF